MKASAMPQRDDDLVTVVKGKPRRRGEMIPLSITAAEARKVKRIRLDVKKHNRRIARTPARQRACRSRLHCCHNCGENLLDISLNLRPHEAVNFCFYCGSNVRTQSAACKCGNIYFDGLRDRRLLRRFCAGCGESLSRTLKGLPQ